MRSIVHKVKSISSGVLLAIAVASASPSLAQTARTSELLLPGHGAPTRTTYEIMGGRALFQGDVEVGELLAPQKTGKFIPHVAGGNGIGSTQSPLSVRTSTAYLWPGGVVPYRVASNVPSSLAANIQAAIQRYHSNTNLRFQNFGNASATALIQFVRDDDIAPACGTSPVGRQSRPQKIRLVQAASVDCILHEIGHAAGLWHEQSRMDRDNYVTVLWNNILSGKEHNFDKHVKNGIDFGQYDRNSIMHYSSTAFGRPAPNGGRMTTIQARTSGATIGGNGSFSAADILGINRLYPRVDCNQAPVLYEHNNYQGRPLVLQHSTPNIGQFKIGADTPTRPFSGSWQQSFNDRVSSICVPMGWTVTLFRHDDYQGDNLRIVGPRMVANFGNAPDGRNWHDKVTSVRVEGAAANPAPAECDNAAVLFQHDHYNGRRLVLDRDIPSFGSQYEFHDKGSAVCVPAGWTVWLFQHSDYRGEFVQIVGPMNIADLHRESPDNRNWGDMFSSVKVNR